MRSSIPLASIVNTSGWDEAVNPVDAPLFAFNNGVMRGGMLENLYKKILPAGTVLQDGRVINIKDRQLVIDDQVVADFSGSLFVSLPDRLSYEAATLKGNQLICVNIAGTVATVDYYNIDPIGLKTLTQTVTQNVAAIAERTRTRIVLGADDSVNIFQLAPSRFAYNEVVYTMAITSQSKLFWSITGIWAVQPGLNVRHFNLSSGEIITLPNAVDGSILPNTNTYIFETMGDPVVCSYQVNGLDDTLITNNFVIPVDLTDVSIYSQQFKRDCAFTILTALAANGDRIFIWSDDKTFSYLEVTADGNGVRQPTVDFNRSADGLTSSLTSQFNYATRIIGQLAEIYQTGVLLAVSFNGVLIAPTGFTDYEVSSNADAIYLIIENNLIVIGLQVPPTNSTYRRGTL